MVITAICLPLQDILRWFSPGVCMYSHRGWSYSSAAAPPPTSAYRRRRFRLPRRPRLPTLTPLPLAIVLVAAAAWYHFGVTGFAVRGQVMDGVSGQPISNARVWSA